MRVLVTGAAGFIGFTVSRHLLARGDTGLGIDSLNDYYDVALKQARLTASTSEAVFNDRRSSALTRAASSGYSNGLTK